MTETEHTSDHDGLVEMFRLMSTIRAFEARMEELVRTGTIRGLVHTSVGNEAVAVGVTAALRPADMLLTGHRGHGHLIAKGADPLAVAAEIAGRSTGLCRGLGGSMHLVDMRNGSIGATGVVGGNLSMALGAAYAAQVRGDDAVTVVFFGDGATGSGVFHETLNLAKLWQLPVLLVCENNQIAEFTTRSEHSVVEHVVEFAGPYGIEARQLPGQDVVDVAAEARRAVASMREQPGPVLLEFATHRLVGHFAGQQSLAKRGGSEAADVDDRDPLVVTRRRLVSMGLDGALLDEVRAGEDARIEELVAQALSDGVLPYDECVELVYA